MASTPTANETMCRPHTFRRNALRRAGNKRATGRRAQARHHETHNEGVTMIDNTPSRTTHITTNHGLDGPHQRCHILQRKARRMIAMRRARHDRCTWEKQHTQVVAAYKRASGVSEARKQRNETATTLPHVFCTSPARSLSVLKFHILPSTVLAQHRQQLGHTPCYCTPLPAPARVNLGAGSDTTVTPTMATPTWQGILAVR